MYKYGIFAVLLLVMPSRAMEQGQAVGDDNELSSSIVVIPQSSPCAFLSSSKFQGTDEEFFDYFNNGPLNYALNCSSANPEAKAFVQTYFTDSAQRGRKLLNDQVRTGVEICNLLRDVNAACQMKATWEVHYRNEQAANLKLQNTVVALGATSLGLAGLATYLYFKKT